MQSMNVTEVIQTNPLISHSSSTYSHSKSSNRIFNDESDKIRPKLYKKLDRVLESKTWKELLWDIKNEDHSHSNTESNYDEKNDDKEAIFSSVNDQNVKSGKDSKENKESNSKSNNLKEKVEDDDGLDQGQGTRIWHDRFVSRVGVVEHRIQTSSYIKELIDSILIHSSRNDKTSINIDIVSQYGTNMSIPGVKKLMSSLTLDGKQSITIKNLMGILQTSNLYDNSDSMLNKVTGSNNQYKDKEIDELMEFWKRRNEENISYHSHHHSSRLPSSNMQSKSTKVASVDVVANLFHMSNELREEREQIRSRVDGNMDAFLYRDVTQKYNEELDEVIQSKQNNKSAVRKAAVLRLRRSPVKHKITSEPKEDDYWTFWNNLQQYQSNYQTEYKKWKSKVKSRYHQLIEPPSIEAFIDRFISKEEKGEQERRQDKDGKSNKSIQTGQQFTKSKEKKPLKIERVLENSVGLFLKTKVMIASRIQDRLARKKLALNDSTTVGNVSKDVFVETNGMPITTKMLLDDKFRHIYGLDQSITFDEQDEEEESDVMERKDRLFSDDMDNSNNNVSRIQDFNLSQQEVQSPSITKSDMESENKNHIKTIYDRDISNDLSMSSKKRVRFDEDMKSVAHENENSNTLNSSSIHMNRNRVHDELGSINYLIPNHGNGNYHNHKLIRMKSKVLRMTTGMYSNNSMAIKTHIVALSFQPYYEIDSTRLNDKVNTDNSNNNRTQEHVVGRWVYDPEEFNGYEGESNSCWYYNQMSSIEKADRLRGTYKEFIRYPIHIKEHQYEEFYFDAESLTIHLSFQRDGQICEHIGLPISTLQIIPSIKDTNMVVLRSSMIQMGYICTIPTFQWAYIEHEIALSMERFVNQEFHHSIILNSSNINNSINNHNNTNIINRNSMFSVKNISIGEHTGSNYSFETNDPIEVSEITLKQSKKVDYNDTLSNQKPIKPFKYQIKASHLIEPSFVELENHFNLRDIVSQTGPKSRPVISTRNYADVITTPEFLKQLSTYAYDRISNKEVLDRIIDPTYQNNKIDKENRNILPEMNENLIHPVKTNLYEININGQLISLMEDFESYAIGHVAMGQEVNFFLAGNYPPTIPKEFKPSISRSPRTRQYRPEKKPATYVQPHRQPHRPHYGQGKYHNNSNGNDNNNNDDNYPLDSNSYTYTDDAIESPMNDNSHIRNEDKAVILIETNRLMQLYFAKKFLQLNMVLDVHQTLYDATEAIMDNSDIYGLIFISLNDLLQYGSVKNIAKSLQDLIPMEIDKNKYSVVVYGTIQQDDSNNSDSNSTNTNEMLEMFEECGILDIIEEPYTIDHIKTIVSNHLQKQSFRFGNSDMNIDTTKKVIDVTSELNVVSSDFNSADKSKLVNIGDIDAGTIHDINK